MLRLVSAAALIAVSASLSLAQAPKAPSAVPGTKVPVKPRPAPATACDVLKGRAYLGLLMTSLAGNVSPGYVRFERKGGVKGYYWVQSASAGAKSAAPTLIQIVKAECKAVAPDKANVQYFTTAGAAGNLDYTIQDGGARIWAESKNANPPQTGWLYQMK